MYVDPRHWETQADQWALEHGEDVVVCGRRTRSPHVPGAEPLPDRPRRGDDHHDDCAITRTHALNARKVAKPGDKFILGKPSEHQKIDALMADVLAHEAASDARAAAGPTRRRPDVLPAAALTRRRDCGALTPSEVALIDRLKRDLDSRPVRRRAAAALLQGPQRVEQLGMAIPPAMRRFLVITNWCRTVVDTINDRQQVRSLILPGEETADPQLRAIWDANNLDAHVAMFNRDRMIYGRAFMSVGANETTPELPLVRVESPREMVALVDYRREVVTAAARFYGERPRRGPTNVTLYLPNQTVWVERRGRPLARDRPRRAQPRRRAGRDAPQPAHVRLLVGESQMTDVIPLVDAAARSLTNLQFAQEAHGIPRMYMTGVEKEDFIDADGKPIPQFEAYFDAIHTITNPAGKVGQLDAADLKNFETALNIYGSQASVATGFPARKFGISSVNPPTEGSIRAEETELVNSVESQNVEVGITLGWVGALALRFATGRGRGQPGPTDWFDPPPRRSRSARTRWRSAARPACCPARATGTSSAGPRRARPRSAPTSRPIARR
jgi:hypothetical protein